jgi:prophage maintenance system killer protein
MTHIVLGRTLSDPDEIARREAENGLRQFTLALDIIRSYVKDAERPFKLRAGPILQLHQVALDGLHRLAGTFRNTPAKIHGSLHQPPEPAFVADEVQALCAYINENWNKSAVHLAAYVLWKMNWIHPFADGNGRTARAVSYVVLSLKLVDLRRDAAIRMGVPSDVAGASRQSLARWWSVAFHEHPEQPDGIIHRSRLNAEANLAIYDRAISKLRVHRVTALINAKGLADVLEELKVALVPSKGRSR